MAADVENDAVSEDILQGSEPGASRNSMLLATDSYEDLASYLSDSNISFERERLSSGSINEITQSDDVQSNDTAAVKSVVSDLKASSLNDSGSEIAENEINERLESGHLSRDDRGSLTEDSSQADTEVQVASDSDTLAERGDLDTPTSQLSEVSLGLYDILQSY